MSENYTDPSGNTEQFRAFAHTPEAAAPAPSRLPLIIAAAVVVVVLLVLAAWLALS